MRLGFIKISLIIIALLAGVTSYAQYFYVPDDSLRACLQVSHPAVFVGDSIDILLANKANTQIIKCENKGLTNLDGIQHFLKVKIITVDTNNITVLPDISMLTDLEFLSLKRNNIKEFPDYSNALFKNSIARIDILGNEITTLPDFNNYTSLKQFHGYDNLQLETFPDFTGSPLKSILLAGSNISKIPNLDYLQTTLISLKLVNMPITDLPDLTELTLTAFNIGKNYLSFEDLIPIVNNPQLVSVLSLTNMLPFTIEGSSSFVPNASFTLKIPIDENITTNTYEWYLNNVLYTTTTSNSLELHNVSMSENGNWSLIIKNSHNYFITNNYTLTTNSKSVNYTECFAGANTSFVETQQECGEASSIQFDYSSLKNYYGNLHTTFVNTYDNKELVVGESLTLNNINNGTYSLNIEDDAGCTYSKEISVTNNKKCDAVMTPNSDGINDVIVLLLEGAIKVYDTNDKLIANLPENTPHWDGKNNNGDIVKNGYYAIIDEKGTIQYVTVVH